MVLFSFFGVAYFSQQTNLKILPVDIFEAFGRCESHFRAD